MQNKIKRKTLGLALGGGTALGVFHIGLLRAFIDHQIPIDSISGTSAGSLVAAGYAFGYPIEKMTEITNQMNWLKISKFAYSKMGLANNESLGKILIQALGDVNIEDAKIPLSIITANVSNGKKIILTKGNLAKAVMASSAIPGLFIPVEIDGQKLVDGGLVENVPVSPMVNQNLDVVVSVDLARWSPQKEPQNILDVMINSIDILTSHQKIPKINDCDILIQPHLENYSPSDFKKSNELILEGYRNGMQVIPKIKELLGIKEATNSGFINKFFDWLKH